MFDIIEKLLILQDRDRKIMHIQEQLARMEPERESLRAQTSGATAALDAAKARAKQIESDRKQRELDVEAKKAQIGKYSLQQFQTKKNEEYRALAHEIEVAQGEIRGLEDQQLELMEQADSASKQTAEATREVERVKKVADSQLKELSSREEALKTELVDLEKSRDEIKNGVETGSLRRYERLLKMKGGSAVVGIEHGVCGGCHMKFPTQIVVTCQAGKELVTCPNCGRILYYSTEMDMAVAE